MPNRGLKNHDKTDTTSQSDKIFGVLIIIYIIGFLISFVILTFNHPSVLAGFWYKMETVNKVLYVMAWSWIGFPILIIILNIGFYIYKNVF